MRELIYYPGFEVKSKDWLKFALLYIDTLSPIVPPSGDRHLTGLYRRLTGETDLLDLHRPEYMEGHRASLDSLDAVEKILRHPDRYYPVFLKSNVVEYWRNPESHDYTLFREKYTDDWEIFCLDNGFATRSQEGVLMPKELCFIYMSILAQAIADGRGVSPVTDYRKLDRFSVITRRVDANLEKKIEIAHSVIKLKLPGNIKHLRFDEIIRFRNRDGFKSKLKAFHTELDRFLSNIEKGETASDFTDSFRHVWTDFTGEIISLGAGFTSLGLGVWVLANAAQNATPELLKEIVAGAAIIGSSISITNTWKNTQSRRYCRKFLADLGRIDLQRASDNPTRA